MFYNFKRMVIEVQNSTALVLKYENNCTLQNFTDKQ